MNTINLLVDPGESMICTYLQQLLVLVVVQYGTVYRKHDANSISQFALFTIITHLSVNILDYL